MIKKDNSLAWLQHEPESWKELAYDHRMDLSGSIYTRMKELGITQSELAEAMGMDQAQISRIIRGKQNLTIKTLAKLEVALQFRLDDGFRYVPNHADSPREEGKRSKEEHGVTACQRPSHLRQVPEAGEPMPNEEPTAAMG